MSKNTERLIDGYCGTRVFYQEHFGSGRLSSYEVTPSEGDRILSPSPTVIRDLKARGFVLSTSAGEPPMRGFADEGGKQVSGQGTYRAWYLTKK